MHPYCNHSGASFPRRKFLFFCSFFAALPSALANYANGNPRLERLFSTFMAPCCWRENLLVHSSPLADELRAEIRKKVEAGSTDEQIKSNLLFRYTTRVLAFPEGSKAVWLSWAPWVMASGGLAALVVYLKKAYRGAPEIPETAVLPDLPDSDI